MRLLMKNGYKEQLKKVVEELTELSVELQKHINKDSSNRDEIIEEYVDAQFMFKQIKYIFELNNVEINSMRSKKIRKIEEIYI